MVVLVRNAVEVFRLRECLRQLGSRLGLAAIDGDVVQTDGTAVAIGYDGHLIGGLQIADGKRLRTGTHHLQTAVFIQRHVAHRHAIHADGSTSLMACFVVGSGCRERHGHSTVATRTRRGYRIVVGGAVGQHLCIVEVAPAVEPCVVVHLVERAVVVGQGIVFGQERGLVDGAGLTVVLGQEIVAVIRIRITHAYVTGTPCHRTDAEEQFPAARHQCGHLLQVVGSRQIVTRQHLRLQSTAVAVYLHATQTAEAQLTDEVFGQLIDTRRGNAYLGPVAAAQYRVGGVTPGQCRSPPTVL